MTGADTGAPVGRLLDALWRLTEQTRDRAPTGLSHEDADDVTGTVSSDDASVSACLADQDGVPIPCEPAAFGLPKVLFRTAAVGGDCCTPALPWEGLPVAELLGRCQVAVAAGGVKIRYLSGPDLILMRRSIGRAKDLRRASELEQLIRSPTRE